MPLHRTSPPPASVTALEAVLQRHPVGTSAFLHARVAGMTPTSPSDSTHPVYSLELDKLAAAGGGAHDASMLGWRYILRPATGASVAAEVRYDGFLAAHSFLSFNEGPFVDATTIQIAAVEQDSRVVAGDYELRLLRVPGLNVVALWLKDRAGPADLVVPFGLAPAPLHAGQVYGVVDFDRLAGDMARARLKYDDRPKP